MDKTIDFTDCKRAHVAFGGSDRKFGIIYDGDVYMLKFSENHAKKHDVSTSYVNNVISGYVSSHIASSLDLPVHETVLGTFQSEIVVGCKDFRASRNVSNIEFAEYVRAKYDSKEIKRLIRLDQIYKTLQDPANDIPLSLQKASIERYWDTFVVNALVGNFDRHIGNWGFLSENNELKLAPIYDFGSTLFPQVSDAGAEGFLKDPYEIMKRVLVFPSPTLVITEKKVGKVGYYDMLSSDYDHHATQAVLRIVPRIDLRKIDHIIDETPFITDTRKNFYKTMIRTRKELILDRAYIRCAYKEFDRESLVRLTSGKQFTENDLVDFIKQRDQLKTGFEQNEKQLHYMHSADYFVESMGGNIATQKKKNTLLDGQRDYAEKYGLISDYVLNSARSMARKQLRNLKHCDLYR